MKTTGIILNAIAVICFIWLGVKFNGPLQFGFIIGYFAIPILLGVIGTILIAKST